MSVQKKTNRKDVSVKNDCRLFLIGGSQLNDHRELFLLLPLFRVFNIQSQLNKKSIFEGLNWQLANEDPQIMF